MSGHRHVRSLGFERPFEPFFAGYDEGPPGHGELRVETLYTGFSAGTELTFMKGTNPYLTSRWDEGRQLFVPGEAGMHYPVPFVGYMECGRVVEGENGAINPGTIVAGTWGHKSGHMLNPANDRFQVLPETIDPILGIYVGQMGPIAANGILYGDAELGARDGAAFGAGIAGRPVLVFGAGVVGLMVGLFAQNAGAAEVVIADPSDFRRMRAECLGMTAMTEAQAIDHVKTRWRSASGGGGADLVFQTRASGESLNNALKALRTHGTVIDLAFYQGGADAVRLGEEFHHNALSIRCAQIGRVPRGMEALWDHGRLQRETVQLLRARGGEIRAQMITHVVPVDDAPRFLKQLVDERPEFIQIVLQYAP